MLSFFRRALTSWVAVALLGLIMIAFIVTGVSTPGGLGGGPGGDAVATVGGRSFGTAEASNRIQSELRQAQQQQPGLTMAQLLAGTGGIDAAVDQLLSGRLLEVWAARHGLAASERLIGGEIAGVPAFQGPTGRFDEQQMRAVLGQQRINYASFHDGIRDDLLRRQLLVPMSAGARAPMGLVTPYAALLLAKREGTIGFVPARADGIAAPTEADITAWYGGHLAAYSLPERRVLRYAPISADTVTVATPVEAEVAAAYKADAAKYAAGESRTLSQVVLPDEAAARAFAAKVKGGTPFARAATEAGFGSNDISLGSVTRDGLTRSASPAVAQAGFAAAAGATTAPIRTELGWTIVHVDAIRASAARSLDQARAEIVVALSAKKRTDAVVEKVKLVQDRIDGGATFDEAVKAAGLAATATPPLIANGAAPTTPAYRPDATVAALLKPAFDASPDDEPTVETIGADGRFALLALGPVSPAAPLPVAQVRPQIVRDVVADRAATRARTVARSILAKVKAGTPIAAAFAQAGQPAPQATAVTQLDVMRAAQSGQPVPPALRTLFRLAPGRDDLAAAPGGGWFVVRLDRIVPGDKAALPGLAAATRGELTRSVGEEYVQQFANAARAEVKIKRNPAAIAALGRDLTGAGAAGQ